MWSADEGQVCVGLSEEPIESPAFVAHLGKGVERSGGADAYAGDAPDQGAN